jgi:hypothetical protein
LPLCRNVSPVYSVQNPALLVVTEVLAPTLLIFLDFQLGLLVGVRAYDDNLPLSYFGPRMTDAAAPKAFVASATLGITTDLVGGIIAVFSKSLLGNAGLEWTVAKWNCSPPPCSTRMISLMLEMLFTALINTISISVRMFH